MDENKKIVVTPGPMYLALGGFAIALGIAVGFFGDWDSSYEALRITSLYLLIGALPLIYHLRKRITLDGEGITVRRILGGEVTYSYFSVTKVTLKQKEMGSPVRAYVGRRKVVSIRKGDYCYTEALARMKQKRLPFDDESKLAVCGMMLWIPATDEEAHAFCAEAIARLEADTGEFLRLTAEEIGDDITITHFLESKENPFRCSFDLSVMQGGKYTKIAKLGKGDTYPWAIFPVPLACPPKAGSKAAPGACLINVNYTEIFSGSMWSNFMKNVYMCGLMQSDEDPRELL